MSTGVGFYSNTTVPIQFWKFSTKKNGAKKELQEIAISIKSVQMRMLYLEPGLLKHPQGSSPPPSLSLGPVNFRFHLLQQHPSIFDQKIRVGGSRGGFFVQRGCWSCHYKSGLEMCLNPWREVKCCVESSKMLALMSPIEGAFEFGTKNSGTTSHLWKKHTQMTSVTLKVQTCESCFFCYHHLPISPCPMSFWECSRILEHQCVSVCTLFEFLAPRLEFFLKIPSFKRNWF